MYKDILKCKNVGIAEAVLCAIGDGVLIADLNINITYVNSKLEEIIELDKKNLIDKNFDEIFNFIKKETMLSIASPVTRAIKEKKSTGLENNTIIVTKKGTEKYISATCSPIIKNNTIIGVVVIMRDITRIKKYEIENMSANENLVRYKNAIDDARDIILFIDLEGNIIEVNKAAIKAYGYSYEELTSMSIFSLRKDDIYVKKNMEDASNRGIFFETEHVCKDGRVIPVEVSSKATIMDSKKVLFSVVRDTLARKKTEEILIKARDKAQVANRAKSEFIANTSHEIRTPINGIKGMIDLTLLTQLTQDQRDNLLTAKICANNLLNIVNDILDFSKLEVGKLSIRERGFSIRDLIEEIYRIHKNDAKKKNLKFSHYVFNDTPKLLEGDSDRIKQILNNFITNAIKFTLHGSVRMEVEVKEEKNKKFIHYTVIDTGIGIKEKDINNLFASFRQAENHLTKEHQGTGLGLAISRKLTKLMGGEILVSSKENIGSKFTLVLPYKKASYLEDSNSQQIFLKTHTKKEEDIESLDKEFEIGKVRINEKGEMIYGYSNDIIKDDKYYKDISNMKSKVKLLSNKVKKLDFIEIENVANKIKTYANNIDNIRIKELSFRLALESRKGVLDKMEEIIEDIRSEIATLD